MRCMWGYCTAPKGEMAGTAEKLPTATMSLSFRRNIDQSAPMLAEVSNSSTAYDTAQYCL